MLGRVINDKDSVRDMARVHDNMILCKVIKDTIRWNKIKYEIVVHNDTARGNNCYKHCKDKDC